MTTSEKRAALEAAGQPWPECCGEPMSWQRYARLKAGGSFRCRVEYREHRRAYRARLQAEGRCIDCVNPADAGLRCRSCADRDWDSHCNPRQQILHRATQGRRRGRQRAAEGFSPTGAGMAAFAAYIDTNRGGVS